MKTQSLQIKPSHLLALQLFVADKKKDNRHVLWGINVTKDHLHATNGHAMARIKTPLNAHLVNVDIDIILDVESLKENSELLKKWHKTVSRYHGTITLEHTGSGTTLSYGDESFKVDVIAGSFPDMNRLIPIEPFSGVAAQFDMDLLNLFVKANKLFGAKSPGLIKVNFNGQTFTRIDIIDEDFIGICAPLRN